MKPIVKLLLTAALMLAVLAYTMYNYAIGKIDFLSLAIACGLIGLPMLRIVAGIFDELKNG